MAPKVSAIIPTVGRADMLRLCLTSLLRQTVAVAEVIVVHCGDDLETPRVAADPCWAAGGMSVRYFQYPERNAAAQRNFAVQQASHDYLLLHDDDVELEPEWVAELLKPMHADCRVGATMGRAVNHPLHVPTPLWRWYRRLIVRGPRAFQPGRLVGAAVPNGFPETLSSPMPAEWLAGALAAVTREAFTSVGGFAPYFTDASPGEDMDLGYRLSRQWTVLYVPTARCVHHEAAGGRSRPAKYHYLWVRGRFATLLRAFAYSRPRALAHVAAWAAVQTISEAAALRKGWRRGLARVWMGRARGLVSCLAWDPPVLAPHSTLAPTVVT